jgi:hypothetical protein
MSTLNTTNIKNPSSATNNIVLDASGNVLINVTAARSTISDFSTPRFQIEGTDFNSSLASICRNSDTAAAAPTFVLARSRGSALGSNSAVQAGDRLGQISFQGNYSTGFNAAGAINVLAADTFAAGTTPGHLLFLTTPVGSNGALERLRITSDGRLGLGTSSPAAPLHVSNTIPTLVLDETDGTSTHAQSWLLRNSNEFQIQTRTNAGVYAGIDYAIPSSTSGATGHVWYITNTERARIDSSGRLLVGTSTSVTTLLGAGLQVHGTGALAYVNSGRWSDNTAFSEYIFSKSRGASVGTRAIVQSGDGLGGIQFTGDDGTSFVSAASIAVAVDGTPGANDMPGRIVFATTADGSSSPTERMRISNAGTTTLTSASSTAPFIANIAASEVTRIDSSGRLLVGTSSARNVGYVSPANVLVETSTYVPFAVVNNTNDFGGPLVTLGKSRGTASGSATIVQANDTLGSIIFAGADGVNLQSSAAFIKAEVDGTPGASDMPGRIVLGTTLDGTNASTEEWRITNDGVICYNQPTPTSKAAAATLTVAELKTAIIQYTGAAATLTLPTGTLTEGGFSGIYTNMTFEWSVINTGTGACGIGAGTAHTIVGSASVAAGATGRFATRRTAANTFVTYRLS